LPGSFSSRAFDSRKPFGKKQFRRKLGEVLPSSVGADPPRESFDTLQDIRRNLGEYDFASQYQQTPAPAGGGMIKEEWFQTYEPGQLPSFEQIVQILRHREQGDGNERFFRMHDLGVKK
jgi:hypothetical protein